MLGIRHQHAWPGSPGLLTQDRRKHMKLRTSVVLFSAIVALACWVGGAAGSDAPRRPLKISLAADRSDSSCAPQREVWKKTAVDVLQGLRPGDLIQVLSVDDKSDGAAPLFHDFYPVKVGSG